MHILIVGFVFVVLMLNSVSNHMYFSSNFYYTERYKPGLNNYYLMIIILGSSSLLDLMSLFNWMICCLQYSILIFCFWILPCYWFREGNHIIFEMTNWYCLSRLFNCYNYSYSPSFIIDFLHFLQQVFLTALSGFYWLVYEMALLSVGGKLIHLAVYCFDNRRHLKYLHFDKSYFNSYLEK